MTHRWMAAVLGLSAPWGAMAGYVGGEVPDAGVIKGSVRLAGVAPAAETFRITKDANVCGESKEVGDLAVGRGNALAGVVVWIDGIASGKQVPEKSDPITLDQRGCVYVPRIQAARVGTRLVLLNSDPVLHNVHGYLDRRTTFNVAMPVKDLRLTRTLSKPGVVDVRCDAGHTWMRAAVHVFEHPYFAVTGTDGSFAFDAVPPGKHKLVFWHERFGRVERDVEVPKGRDATVGVEMRGS